MVPVLIIIHSNLEIYEIGVYQGRKHMSYVTTQILKDKLHRSIGLNFFNYILIH